MTHEGQAGYVHVEVETVQSPKWPDWPCGDVVAHDRGVASTAVICVDGIGSGAHAHIVAEFAAGRLLESLRLGTSLRRAVAAVVCSMERNREPGAVFAAFTVARILNDGLTTVLAYEAPPPLLVSRRHAAPLPARPVELGGALLGESECFLAPGDGLLLMSDGITQAGLGRGLAEGWRTEGVLRHVNSALTGGLPLKELPASIHREARRLQVEGGDDCTVVAAFCRRGQIVNILTGPPAAPTRDAAVVRRFMRAEGLKIVCGGTTAEIVARVLGESLEVESDPQSLVAPPRYRIPGVDLVTEGAVTLNQVYNVLDEDPGDLKEDSGVTDLLALLHVADRVNILEGTARNPANADISFRQRGILTRERIVPLLAEKLRAAGKLVALERGVEG